MAITNIVSNIGDPFISTLDEAHPNKKDELKNKLELATEENDIAELKTKLEQFDKLIPTKWMIAGLDGFTALRCQEKLNDAFSLKDALDTDKVNETQGLNQMSKLLPFYYETVRFGLKDVQGADWCIDGKKVDYRKTDVNINFGGNTMKYKVTDDTFLQTLPMQILMELAFAVWDKCVLNQGEKKK